MDATNRKSSRGLLGMVGALAAVALLSFGMLAGSLFTRPAAAQSATGGEKTIVVAGVGEVKIQPDKATVNFQIHLPGATAEEALAAYEKAATALAAKLKELGLADADIVVQSPYTWPNTGPDGITAAGYYADGTISANVSDLAKLRDIVTEGLRAEAGIGLSGIQYGLKDDAAAQTEAMNKAIDNARSQADAVAAKLGLTVGAVVNITVNTSYPGPIMYDRMNSEVAQGGSNFTELGTRPDIVVNSNVQVSYSFQ